MQATGVATILRPQSPYIYGVGYEFRPPGRGSFFSSRYFQSCVVDKLGHVTHHQLVKHLLTMLSNMYMCFNFTGFNYVVFRRHSQMICDYTCTS